MLRVLLILLLCASGVGADEGHLVEHQSFITAPQDGYALYLPPDFDLEKRWPLLLVFDPRGRAVEALEIFRPAAQRFGWMVLSAEGTRSDGPWEPNEAVLVALDLELERLPIDRNRIVAAGFSGGAAVVWRAEQRLGGLLGLIPVGGRPVSEVMPNKTEAAVFVVAGDRDFNYWPSLEVVDLAESRGAVARFESFPGSHRWIDEELAMVALRWIEIEAMSRGLRPVDLELIAEASDRELDLAQIARREGRLLEAEHRLRLAAQIDGEAGRLRELSRRVADDPRLLVQRKAEKKARRVEELALMRLRTAAEELELAEPAHSADRIALRLGLSRVLEDRSREDSLGAAARRVESAALAQFGFYSPARMRELEAWDRAAIALELALRIEPESPRLWLELASVRALGGREEKARTALAEARRHGAEIGVIEDRPELDELG